MKLLETVINSNEDLLNLYAGFKMDLHSLAAEDVFQNEDLIDSFDSFVTVLNDKLERIFSGKTVISNAIEAVEALFEEARVGPLVEVFCIESNGFGYGTRTIAEFDPYRVEMILDSGIRLVDALPIHTSTLVFHSGRELVIALSPNYLGRLVDKHRSIDGKAND